jgi:hypothetical protein
MQTRLDVESEGGRIQPKKIDGSLQYILRKRSAKLQDSVRPTEGEG